MNIMANTPKGNNENCSHLMTIIISSWKDKAVYNIRYMHKACILIRLLQHFQLSPRVKIPATLVLQLTLILLFIEAYL